MKKLLKLEHDTYYYWGLFLMMLLPIALVLEFWKFSFCAPAHFPIYLCIYGFGYILLLKSDLTRQITSLEEEVKKLSEQLPVPVETTPEPEASPETLDFV